MVTKKRDSKRPKFRGKNNIQKPDRLGYCPEDGFDYKAVGLLKKYISETGKIDSAKRNGLSAKCQRNLTSAIKRARHMALLPFSSNHVYDTSLLSLDKDKLNDNSSTLRLKRSKPFNSNKNTLEKCMLMSNNVSVTSDKLSNTDFDSNIVC